MKKLKMTKGCSDVVNAFEQTKAKVTIETRVKNGVNTERHELTVEGTIYNKEGTFVCTYDEQMDVGKVKTIVKISDETATIIRNGALSMRQQYVVNERINGTYTLPYGGGVPLSMTTKATRVQLTWDGKRKGTITLAYDLWIQGEFTGTYNVTMKMEGVQT